MAAIRKIKGHTGSAPALYAVGDVVVAKRGQNGIVHWPGIVQRVISEGSQWKYRVFFYYLEEHRPYVREKDIIQKYHEKCMRTLVSRMIQQKPEIIPQLYAAGEKAEMVLYGEIRTPKCNRHRPEDYLNLF